MSAVLRFLADENFDNDIVRGLLRRLPDLDLVRVQDVGQDETPDPQLLEWAAQAGRVILTHDARTMPRHDYTRLRAGLPVAGVCIVPLSLPAAQAIDDLLLVAGCSVEDDWRNQVRYLPL